ncbi:MAG: aryl-sulfate sulfotransferase [Melioribacteraceae bacterium]
MKMNSLLAISIIVVLTNLNSFGVGEEKSKQKQSSAADIPKFSIVSSFGCDTNYIFLGPTTSSAPYIMIIDNKGTPVFVKKAKSGVYDFKPQPNGTLSYYDRGGDCYYVMNKDYEIIDSIKCLNGIETDIHELRILSNGNYLILGTDTHKADMSKIVENGSTSATIIGYVIQEIDKNKKVIFEWRTWDNFEITDSFTDLKQNTIDVAHGNSIEVDNDGNFLVSFRNTQEVTKIDRGTGKIIWRWGGKKNQFKYINDALGFSWQHAARRLPNGNIMLFDNGFRREPSSLSFSRALEYKIDELNKIVTLVWQYRNTPDIYSIGLGYSQRLKNGNTFIAWGAAIPAITEVTKEGKEVFELSFVENYSTYRAYRFPWKHKIADNAANIAASVDNCILEMENNKEVASKLITLKNPNPFAAVVTSITNNERSFYIPYEFPAEISANDSLSFTVYYRPNLGGKSEDTLHIETNYNSITIPMVGKISTGISLNEREVPNDFKLEQNYPNPFNPETTISYKVQAASKVSLKVYDVLGREVATLVDEYKQAGSHNCKLRIVNGELSSGIYFYRLQSGSYCETKKFVLMK